MKVSDSYRAFGEDPAHERVTFFLERVSWVVVPFLLLGALLGLFGGGPLARAEAHDAGSGLTLRFERFARAGREQKLRFDGEAQRWRGVPLSVHLPRKLLDAVSLNDIQPKPETTRADAQGVTFVFAASTSPAVGNVRLATFRFDAEDGGTLDGEVHVSAPGLDAALPFSQWVYP